jgi:hypothetical protein
VEYFSIWNIVVDDHEHVFSGPGESIISQTIALSTLNLKIIFGGGKVLVCVLLIKTLGRNFSNLLSTYVPQHQPLHQKQSHVLKVGRDNLCMAHWAKMGGHMDIFI